MFRHAQKNNSVHLRHIHGVKEVLSGLLAILCQNNNNNLLTLLQQGDIGPEGPRGLPGLMGPQVGFLLQLYFIGIYSGAVEFN